jgi:transcriptional regulator with XRE-family HTH domain
MEVQINSQLVVAEREKRAWSQQHLAEVTGLAVRTIQRIETSGAGSYESVKAIASCLEVPLTALRANGENQTATVLRSRALKVAGSIVATSLLVGVTAIFWGSVFAQQVLVDVGVTREVEVVGEASEARKDVRNVQTQFVVDSGQEMGNPLEGEFNLVITPTILDDGRVLLSVKFYEHQEHGFELVGEPRVITPSGEEVELVFPLDEDDKGIYRVAIKPQVR